MARLTYKLKVHKLLWWINYHLWVKPTAKPYIKFHSTNHKPSKLRRILARDYILYKNNKVCCSVSPIRWCFKCMLFIAWDICDNCGRGYCLKHCEYDSEYMATRAYPLCPYCLTENKHQT